MDFVNELGLLALGSRLRRLSDRIMASGQEIYRATNIDFEPRWFPLFAFLAEHGPETIGACARSLGLTHAAVSQTSNVMSKQGLLASRRDAEDERRRLLELTPRGRELLPALRGIWEDVEAGVQEVVDYGGVDVLAAVEGIEQGLAVQSLSERVSRHRAERLMNAVTIVEFVGGEGRDAAMGQIYAEAFKTLNVEWLEKYFELEPVDREVLWHPQALLEGGGALLFAEVGGEVVGTCALQRHEDGGCELTKMAVTEARQGRQIGKRLLRAALERARAMGLETLFLVTNSSLTAALNLYRKHGFRVTSCGQHDKYARGDLTMELAL